MKKAVVVDEKTWGFRLKKRGFSMKKAVVFDEKNVGFSMKKAGIFDEKATSPHALFWNSHNGIFQAQSLSGGP